VCWNGQNAKGTAIGAGAGGAVGAAGLVGQPVCRLGCNYRCYRWRRSCGGIMGRQMDKQAELEKN